METQNTQNLAERFNEWVRNSVSIKLLSIGFLILILLIPSSWISNLMEERQQRAGSVMEEVAKKWSGSQTLAGPILAIPFTRVEKVDRGIAGVEFQEVVDYAFFLPDVLKIEGKVNPQVLHRGIFDAAVYESTLAMNAEFPRPDFASLKIDERKVHWNEAKLLFGLTDLRGISESPHLTSGGKILNPEPTSTLGIWFKKSPAPSLDETSLVTGMDRSQSSVGIVAVMDWGKADDFQGDITFKLSLKGSSYLYFLPLGKTTELTLAGPWANPSFDGEFLPISRSVSETGFDAKWKVLHFNRPFSQQWIGENKSLSGNEFGVKLIIPVDQYQKSIRTSKYAILLVMLSFVALLMVEIVKKIRIHPFQYILVGAALIIYYTLLLSFSEHIGYDLSYLISAISTVSLVVLYTRSFLPDGKVVSLFGALLLVFYTFIYVIIQAQDFSLLIGSVGLFLVVALLMYLSRSIRWYGDLAK